MASGLFDLVFRPGTPSAVGVMLDRPQKDGRVGPAVVEGGYSPAEVDDPSSQQSVPEIQDDFSGGALYSKRIIPNGYAYGAPVYARSPRGATPPGRVTSLTLPSPGSPLGGVSDSFEINGDLYLLAGRYALVVDGGDDTSATVAQDLGASFVADGAAVFNGDAYIGGSGGNIWRCDESGVWTQSADVSHRKAAVVTWLIPTDGLMRARLVMADSTLRGVRYTGGDPMVLANWTPNPSYISVGDSTYPISSIVAAPNHVYIPKQDGLHDLNSRGETPNLTPYWRTTAITSDNGLAAFYHNFYIHLGHASGADRVDVSTSRRQQLGVWTLPPFGVPNRTPIVGPVTAWALDQGWLMASVYNANTGISYVGAGRNRGEPGVPDGPGAMLWHFAEALVQGRVSHMRVTAPNGIPRLWICSRQGTTTRISWQDLPNANDPVSELENDTDFRFGSQMVLYTTTYDWQDPDAVKILRVIGLRADNLGVTAGVTVSASSEGGNWTVQSTARTSPRTKIRPREPLTEGHEISLLLVGEGSSTVPPVISSIKMDAERQTEHFDRRNYNIKVGKGQSLRNGSRDIRNAQEVWSAVTDLHTDGVMELRDNLQGATLNVRVHPIPGYRAVEETVFTGEYTYTATLPVTVLDIVSGSAVTGTTWGSGAAWGDGTKWGAA